MSDEAASSAKRGRPTAYSGDLAEKICERISKGESERQISKSPDMPSVWTIRRWKDRYPEFCSLSARAREISAELYDDRRRDLCDWLIGQAKSRAASGEDFPKGVVESVRASMQELARSASMRDDSRFGDRKTVKVDATPQARGMMDVYARMIDAQNQIEEDDSGGTNSETA